MTKVVGRVSPEETKEVLAIHSRKVALEQISANLLSTGGSVLDHPDMLTELGTLSIKLDSWWQKKAKQYNWESAPNGNWTIDFDSGDIVLNY